MPIRVVCRSCGRQLNAPDKLAGRKVKCPQCQAAVPIPAAVSVKAEPPAPKERSVPKRRPPDSDEQITTERKTRRAPEAEEEVEIARAKKKPKRKKSRPAEKLSDQMVPTWMVWLISLGGIALLAGLIAGAAIYKGHGAEVLVYSIILAVMIPISTVILIASMFISSWLGGGIEFGEAHIVIPKAAALLFVINMISLIPFGRFIAAPIWWGGLMVLFGLDLWEVRILVVVNWGLNFLAQMAVFSAITAMFAHDGLHFRPSHRSNQPAVTSEVMQAVEAIDNLGGDCSAENEDDDGPIVTVTLARTKATDADLARLKSFPKLRTLDLSATPITDAGLVHLKQLNQLQTVILTGTRVTDAGVADLQTALPRAKIIR
jgi:hypothetical protein